MIDRLLPTIEAAGLSATLYRTAVRIAARTDSNGVARLDWSAMLELVETTSKETARGQLDRLITAGVFDCKRNHNVLIVWKLQPGNLRESRNFTGSDGETYANRVTLPDTIQPGQPANLRESRNFAGSDGETYANRVTLPVAPVGKNLTTGKVGRKDQPTYLPVVEGVQGEPQPLTDAERSLALLTDPAVGVTGKLLEIVGPYSFEQIRLQVFQALRQMADPNSRIKSIGVIEHRLKVGAAATVTDADRASDLWRRHETYEDGEAERRRKYIPADFADIAIS